MRARSILCAVVVIAAFSAGASEVLFRFGDAVSYPTFVAPQVFLEREPPPLSLPEYSGPPRFSRFDAMDSRHALFGRELLRLSALSRVQTGPLFSVFNRRLASRRTSGAWAGLHAGYGDVLCEDQVGRARMNGAGTQDPDSFYLKLTFKF